MIRIIDSGDVGATETIKRLLNRKAERDDSIQQTVRGIVDGVRARGITAALEYTEAFDKARLTPETVEVSRAEVDDAYAAAGQGFVDAVKRAANNIRAYHEKQKRLTWIDFQPDRSMGQLILPIERAGIYAPGGRAGYPSTVLMNAIPARVAGVREIVMVTPPGPDGRASYAASLVAADVAGVDRIFKLGGAQAIAALAYGADPVPAVDKIVGPGNVFVQSAKRMVFGQVGIDSVAGPSDVLVVADDTARPEWVAADMMAQAEHDPDAAAMLVTTSRGLAEAVRSAAATQFKQRKRQQILARSLADNSAAIVVRDLNEAMAFANDIAPEHLELCVADPFALLGRVRNAGAVFIGHYTPESAGDYYAGPNHVLPTNGTARVFSPLSVDDFTKRTSVLHFSREALMSSADDIETLALAESLDAHAYAVTVRRGE
ncbi:MAG: histidinol dehydrogenase [Oscillospiraceae bacterium]|jgi:histidinol dehydrogenase|nr:histidinol dehydrogenase [Oscillospiraceae bacterium]